MKILSSSQILAADEATVLKERITSEALMERAGTAIYNWIRINMMNLDGHISIFCGTGNNGGDGLVVARKLLEQKKKIHLYKIAGRSEPSADFLANEGKLKSTGAGIQTIESASDLPPLEYGDIVIDAIFGIGLNRTPTGIYKETIQHINNSKAVVLAIDLPSGLFPETPVEDHQAVIKADWVLTLQLPKFAFFLPENYQFVKRFEILEIGLDKNFIEDAVPIAQLIGRREAKILLKERNKFDHKGTFGHVAIVGGSYGKMGSIILATKAALRVGAGMVTSFVPGVGVNILQIAVPEAMVVADKNDKELTSTIPENTFKSIAVGMGMGTSEKTMDNFEKILRSIDHPIVIDADGINCLAEKRSLIGLIPKLSILTPHPKELERLIGKWANDYDKIEKAKGFSAKFNVILVIKGANTMVIFRESIYINSSGNPGMATAGSGDALSGIISGLMAQDYDSLMAAILGTFIHGLAGDIGSENLGENSLIAGDIIENLPGAFRQLREL